jgi:hypothetical protein
MNSDPGDFDSLLKLMALKRHEQPPPGYFNRLPGKILDRIERGEGQPRFWEKFVTAFAFRPAMAYASVLAAFSALTFSVIYSVKTQPQDSAQNLFKNSWRTGGSDAAYASQLSGFEPLHVINWMGNTNSSNAEPALPSLFDANPRDRNLLVAPVSFASPP